MKTISFFTTALLLVLSSILATAQNQEPSEHKNLYNKNGEPKSCEDNFKNLFSNWNQSGITNAKELKFTGYKSLGKIKDTTQISRYIDQIASLTYPFLSTAGQSSEVLGPDIKERYIKFESLEEVLNKVPAQHKAEATAEFNKMLAQIRAGLLVEIKVGYEAFSVKSVFNGKPVESLVFCDPATHKVMVDMHFKTMPID